MVFLYSCTILLFAIADELCVGTGQFLVSWVLLGKSDSIPGHGEVMRIYFKYQKVYDAYDVPCKSSKPL